MMNVGDVTCVMEVVVAVELASTMLMRGAEHRESPVLKRMLQEG